MYYYYYILSAVISCSNHFTRNDSVEIADGYKTRIGDKLCGNLEDLQSASVRVRGASAYVKFKSDPKGTGNGFRMTYQALGKRKSKRKPRLFLYHHDKASTQNDFKHSNLANAPRTL